MRRLLAPVAFLVAAVVIPSASAHVAVADPSTERPGFTQIAGCISGADNLLVSVVVDESLSLRDTDPKALRVLGITSAIDSLEQLAAVSPDVNVEMSLSTFARTFTTLVDWTPLDAASADEFRKTAADELPRRDAGNATDYREALLGSQKALITRAGQLHDKTACKVVLWFTDGALDVDADTDVALSDICRPGGIADSVRHDGINVVALALFSPDANVSDAQRDQLKAVAEGRGDNTTCGTAPISSDDAMGVYLPADDPAALQLLFAGAGALVAGGADGGTVKCPSGACPDGTYSLAVDPGLSGARMIVQGDSVGHLRAPGGQDIELSDSTSASVDGAQVTVLRRGSLTTLNLTFDPYSKKPQTWTLLPGGPATVATYWFWGASLVAAVESVQAGTSNLIRYRLVDAAGDVLAADLYGRLDASISVGGKPLDTTISSDGFLEANYDIGTGKVPSHIVVSAAASARTKPSGISLGPIQATNELPVTLPPAYPVITPTSLDFGALEGLGTRSAKIKVAGSKLGETSVCLAGSSIVVPGQESSSKLVTSEPTCVKVPANGEGSLKLFLEPTTSADGVASGDIAFDVTSADGDHLEVTVPGSLSMERAVDSGKRWKVVAALIILALLIPLLLIVGSNLLLLGRFRITSGTRTARIPVRIAAAGLSRVDAKPGLVYPDDLRNVPISGSKSGSRMSVDGTSLSLRAARILSLQAPRGIATAHSGSTLMSGYQSNEAPEASNEASIGLGDLDALFVRIDRLDGPDQASGELVVVIPQDVDAAGAEERARVMVNDVEWPRVLEQLGAASRSAPVDIAFVPNTDVVEGGDPLGWLDREAGASSEPDRGSVPRLPDYLSEGDGDADPAPSAPTRPRRLRGTRPTREAQQSPVESADRDLPPLPDFLRDED